MSRSLSRAHVAGACPDELLAALRVVYLRSLSAYAEEHPTDVPLAVADDYYTMVYGDEAEVV